MSTVRSRASESFEDLEAEVGVERMSGEPGVDGGLGFGAVLAVEEGREPGAEEENFASALDVGEGVEGAGEVRLGERAPGSRS